ncbi:MAG TPA: serine protease [Gammaproteobacteria bacterium]|nr:serine protease [Gammaproteobacteria bacterium]
MKEKLRVFEQHLSASSFRSKIMFSVLVFFVIYLGAAGITHASGMVATIAKVKKSVVGVGTMMPTRSPRASLFGTGFVVADGNHVLTNAHVVSRELDFQGNESLVVFIGRGVNPETRSANIVQLDKEHDLALLKIPGPPLKALSLGDSDTVQEGEQIAFTGYPIGAVLGLYPVTHRGIISAITPIVIPMDNGGQLTPELIKRLRARYDVFQLDATAYPGNSGSPLYDPDTGEVLGILNMVFVKESRETVLQKPSGIAYAIPSRYAVDLINKLNN